MNYLILIIVGIAGIALGSYFGRRKNGGELLTEQEKKKRMHKETSH